MKLKPKTFRTQREAYWYKKGYQEAKKQINDMMNERIKMYSLDYVDHLPTGDEK